jgi:hypothetical protein
MWALTGYYLCFEPDFKSYSRGVPPIVLSLRSYVGPPPILCSRRMSMKTGTGHKASQDENPSVHVYPSEVLEMRTLRYRMFAWI